MGDPATNGLGHSVTTTVDPKTQQKVQAVFIPKLKAGYWSGEVENLKALTDRSVVDSHTDAIRQNQLCAGSINNVTVNVSGSVVLSCGYSMCAFQCPLSTLLREGSFQSELQNEENMKSLPSEVGLTMEEAKAKLIKDEEGRPLHYITGASNILYKII